MNPLELGLDFGILRRHGIAAAKAVVLRWACGTRDDADSSPPVNRDALSG